MNGIFPTMPDADYRAQPGLSYSYLKIFMRSPAHYKWAVEHPEDPKPQFVFGRLLHHLCLTPDQPLDWLGIVESTRSKEGQAAKERYKGYVISAEDAKTAHACFKAVMAHPIAKTALGYVDGVPERQGQPEVSVFCPFNLGGTTQRKGRIDFVTPGNALVDIKTTTDARVDEFSRDMWTYCYYVQAAYYLDLYNDARPEGDPEKTAFVFVAVEKEPPFGIVVHRVDEATIKLGRLQYIAALQKYMECEQSKYWPCYEEKIWTTGVPPWALSKAL